MGLEMAVKHGLISFDIPYDGDVLKNLCLYVTELTKWNRKINLVGLKSEDVIVVDLLYDAFYLYAYVKKAVSVLDMGSGAGILAIPLKILNKEMKVFSIDRTLKKIQFQRHIQRTLKFNTFFPIHGRIESIEALNVQCLIAKAFGSTLSILTKGGRHVIKGGHAFLLRGMKREVECVEGFVLQNLIPYTLPDSVKARNLFVYQRY
ncbi:MAG: Ribosomal RNA small subunit methyltransferase G [Deltaproteobacteria bacterium ADurb.Bin135]|jgi:16S rRNA (guanine527-N7)-methyltransferase|nr:MAG: Ribosomal RNA small subunit methyltransferase G [Deltaproteobacteria bacterium ADurb.Bin135]HNY70123.1 class I SAM-dependent methyltransferase [Syntrophorhabdus sp.]